MSTLKAVVQVDGRTDQRYFTITKRHLRLLGLVARPGAEHELLLAEGADPDTVLRFPNGMTFTALELTELANKSTNARGWQVDCFDPGGYPPSEEA